MKHWLYVSVWDHVGGHPVLRWVHVEAEDYAKAIAKGWAAVDKEVGTIHHDEAILLERKC